ncbi:phage tail protein [Neisseria musculi]|uniref:Phage P2 GpU family protein n=1 Tax=Neisseria musculi TaxID=1815583 RepID=A0A7H1MCG1_9NEIS|nr:phage tail protein [Neisseria musculi]QNT59326.1 phage P2 GpU family protein [Neisseria musculi]
MYAMLGGVRFELLNSFTSLETEHAAWFARHDVLQGKPRLQATGNGLAAMRFTLKLHWRLGNPDTAYHGLLAAQESQQAQALVYGSGRFAGWWVIERLVARTLIQDAQGRTAAREVDVELTEFAGDPNNPLPAPAVMQAGKSPLLSLLPESVQAQASDIMQAVETGVKIYRAAEGGIAELLTAAKELKHDPAALLNLAGDALGAGSGVLAKLNGLPEITAVSGDLSAAGQMAAQLGQAGSLLGDTAGSLRQGVASGTIGGWLDAAVSGTESAADAAANGAAAAETLTAYLACRRDL